MLDGFPVAPIGIKEEADLHRDGCKGLLERAQLFVDAVLGTGFRPPMRGLAVAGRKLLERYPQTPVVAVDLPSGWDADSREFFAPDAYRADAVVTFTAPKLAHVSGMLTRGGHASRQSSARTHRGGAHRFAGGGSRVRDRPDLGGQLQSDCGPSSPRRLQQGPLRACPGDRRSQGQVRRPLDELCRRVARRRGPGHRRHRAIDFAHRRRGDAGADDALPCWREIKGEISSRNLEAALLDPVLEKKSVIAVGPGMGQEEEAVKFFLGLLERTKVPMVIDADALNALAAHPGHLNGRGRLLVLTPHPGEMARLAGMSIPEVEADREGIARQFATSHAVTLVLKGWRTLIAHPDGRIAINTTGNPGMAKGGSGDILTGIVAAMIGQYPEQPAEAVEAAIYLHGLAADFAVRWQDQHTLLAMDTVSHLYEAFRFRAEDQGGYVWLQGIPGMLKERE